MACGFLKSPRCTHWFLSYIFVLHNALSEINVLVLSSTCWVKFSGSLGRNSNYILSIQSNNLCWVPAMGCLFHSDRQTAIDSCCKYDVLIRLYILSIPPKKWEVSIPCGAFEVMQWIFSRSNAFSDMRWGHLLKSERQALYQIAGFCSWVKPVSWRRFFVRYQFPGNLSNTTWWPEGGLPIADTLCGDKKRGKICPWTLIILDPATWFMHEN